MSDRGGRDDFDPSWEKPPRRAGGSRYDREGSPMEEPLSGGRRGDPRGR